MRITEDITTVSGFTIRVEVTRQGGAPTPPSIYIGSQPLAPSEVDALIEWLTTARGRAIQLAHDVDVLGDPTFTEQQAQVKEVLLKRAILESQATDLEAKIEDLKTTEKQLEAEVAKLEATIDATPVEIKPPIEPPKT